MKLLRETIKQLLIEIHDDIDYPPSEYLYHGTSIKNVPQIEANGLIPTFGELVKSTEGYQYYMDDEFDEYGGGYSDSRVEGVLFFSDDPDTWKYGASDYQSMEEAALVIVNRDDSIYQSKGMGVYTDIDGNEVYDIDGIDVDRLPPFIETSDYFSFEEQYDVDILTGERLKRFVEKYKNEIP